MSPAVWMKSKSKRMPDRSLVKANVDGIGIESPIDRGVFVPRTSMGKRLWEIRSRILRPGSQLIWEDLDRDLGSRRGG
jgi:hypothetical protein